MVVKNLLQHAKLAKQGKEDISLSPNMTNFFEMVAFYNLSSPFVLPLNTTTNINNGRI
jgi:hypothetical protein